MLFTVHLRDRLRSMSDKTSSNNNKESLKTTAQNATNTTTADSRRSITFDFDNELTRHQAFRMNSGNDDMSASGQGKPPPAYSRYHRDSGVFMRNDVRDSSKRRSTRSRDVSPMSRGSFSSSRPLSARMPRLSSDTDDSKRMSLGSAMEQWRLEDEEWQSARGNGESLTVLLTPTLTTTSTLSSTSASQETLSAWPSQSPFDEGKGRSLSLGAAMEQWRREEDEDARHNGQLISMASPPAAISTYTAPSGAWPKLSRRLLVSSPAGDEGPTPTLGPAMDQWRVEAEEELRTRKTMGAKIPVLLPLAPSRSVSKWPSRSPFNKESSRDISIVAAMEQWRVEAEDNKGGAQQHTETPQLDQKSVQASPLFGEDVSGHRLVTLGPAMEQWRLEELDQWRNDGGTAAITLPKRIIQSPASGLTSRVKPDRAMSLGPAMEAWRLEEVCW
ncbi:hypothetical protein GQ53DRAFT_743435 [Thozetella sp. PMI_491]|nr:hypothetical protein GQ53DRAFT_743435 [Thozetella sp. PMI_491]